MADTDEERRLAAILAADVVGYSRLMGEDEAGTLAAVRKLRAELIEPRITEHKGRLFKAMGDGFLAEFQSVVNAVACAAAIQKVMAARNAERAHDRQMNFRIGVHLGDVIAEGGDVFGDGVNVAARIEALAEPGGVAISAMVHDNIGSRLDLGFEDIGEHQLKNIAKPLRIYRLVATSRPTVYTRQPGTSKPSIAVLPFTNMSADPEQEYFSDGIVEDIITALSRFNQLFVIARNSTFTYKGKAVDIKQVGRELGVRYVLEGSVRKAQNRVRITGQLIDASTGANLWADRFDGEISDIFDLQDQVTASVVGAIAPRLEQAEMDRALQKPTENMEAYDHFLRGMAAFHAWTREGNAEAFEQFKRAIELDGNYSESYAMAARCLAQRKSCGWTADHTRDVIEARALANKAAELGRDNATALCGAGVALWFVVGDLERAQSHIDEATKLNPNMAWAWLASSLVRVSLGQAETAIEHAARAMRLSPRDSQIFVMCHSTALAHLILGHFEESLSWAKSATLKHPDHIPATAVEASSAALAGNLEAAQKAVERLLVQSPHLHISNLAEIFPLGNEDDFHHWKEGLRLAGLPE